MDSNSKLEGISQDKPLLKVDGQVFIQMTRAGMALLEANYEYVNSLNVFPVPDGDTGTNMLLTMRSACREVANSEDKHTGEVAQKVYNGALMGARGNSGVILSQLWRGFAHGLDGTEEIDAQTLARGLTEASRTAYSAVQEPVEGTMLTVAREAAEEATLAVEKSEDIREVLEHVLERAQLSIKRTPELLPVLKEAGVVDAGGVGFAYILEGMLRYAKGEVIEISASDETPIQESSHGAEITEEDLEYPYDVQFLIKGSNLNVNKIRSDIESMGDSGVIVGDQSLVKVHIHVTNPGVPISYGSELGWILDVVVENMQEQYHEFAAHRHDTHEEQVEDIAPPTIEPDSIASVTVAPGPGFKNIFYSLGAGVVIEGGQTMNPSTAQILEAINSLPTDKVIVLPNNKNIRMAAEQAAEQALDKSVTVIPTRTIPQGISALLALDPDGDYEAVLAGMSDSSQMVETGEVTVATRNATIDGVKCKENQIIGLHNDLLKIAGNDLNATVVELLEIMNTEEYELVTLYYGEDVSQSQAEAIAHHLEETYPDHEIELRFGGQAHYFYILSVE